MGVLRNRADHRGLEFCTDESFCARPGCHLGQTDSGRGLRHNERYIIRIPALDADTPAIPQFLDGVSTPLQCGRNFALRKVCLCGRAAVCVVEGAQIAGSGTRRKIVPATGRIFCLTGTSKKYTSFRYERVGEGVSALTRGRDGYIATSIGLQTRRSHLRVLAADVPWHPEES